MLKDRKYAWISLVLGVGFLYIGNRHWAQMGINPTWYMPINMISFLYLLGMIIMAYANKPFTYRKTNKLKVSVVVPMYNEDPETFRRVLESLDAQTLAPHRVYIIDDGSQTKECKTIYLSWRKKTALAAEYHRKPNSGKRDAQAYAFKKDKDSDVFATIDSDTVLDKNALKNGIRPFGEPKVMSVAGLLVGLNHDRNLLTRLVDLGFVSSFINGRAAWSSVKSVAVNCGGLAFYRAWVVKKYLNEYVTQTVLGTKANSGDDRILTDLALLEGWGVFQDTSLGYTVLPEKMWHLLRQRVRWWRSFFWGGVWLLRRFTPDRTVWWLVLWQFMSFTFYTMVIFAVLTSSASYRVVPWGFILYLTFVMSYIRCARYLMLDLPTRHKYSKYLTFSLAPLSAVLHFLLCSVLQYVGLFTVGSMGWSTRKKVEVSLTHL